MYHYLYNVDSPDDLKKLKECELQDYCNELRQFILEESSRNPGHLGSSLGVVELTVALHYVFDTPNDKLIWDVGHQAYAHKIITGRRDRFSQNRKLGGLSGFPKPSESPYDTFSAGHASNSISAALGISTAAKLKGEKRQVVAVIGDGSMTGGLAFEGLNNAGILNTDLLVILNDNNMSIDNGVGALNRYLLKITTSERYNRLKSHIWDAMSSMPELRRMMQNVTNTTKQGLLRQSNLFESLNFRYFGPIDGHDVVHLSKVLADLKSIRGPKLLHVLTTKGKGYAPAENDPSTWHAPGKFDLATGERVKSATKQPPKFQDVFGETLLELARKNSLIVGITPAMPSGSSLSIMMEQLPERCFDVGIAEGHAVTFSAGLAREGMMPFCAIYSSFMQRAYDNVIHDAALQNLDIVFCLDRAGLVGEDGATHHGAYDVAYLRCVPNMTIAAPMNEVELRNIMYTVQSGGYGPVVIRYPRGNGVMLDWKRDFETVEIGKSRTLRDGRELAVLSLGETGNWVSKAIDRIQSESPEISVTHVDLRFAKPLDTKMLHRVAAQHTHVITVENGVRDGGVGSAVTEFFNDNNYNVRVCRLGIPDEFVEQGTPDELKHLCGFDEESVYLKIKELYNAKVNV